MAVLGAKPSGRYHHGDLRRALIAAAFQMVEEEGLAALSVRALTRRLGVSASAPARHFRSRAALLGALAAEGFVRFAQALEEAAAGVTDRRERLLAVGRAYIAFALERPGRLRAMFDREVAEMGDAPPELAQAAARAHRVLVLALSPSLEIPASREDLPPAVREAAAAAWALVHGAAVLWMDGPLRHAFGGDRATFEAAWERMCGHFAPALLAAADCVGGRPISR